MMSLDDDKQESVYLLQFLSLVGNLHDSQQQCFMLYY